MDVKSALFVMLTACVVFTLCFIMIRSKGASVYSVILKAIASFAFVATFLVSLIYVKDFSYTALGIGLGLVAGLIGDILLDLKVVYPESNSEYLYSGFVSFGIGHLFYIFAMLMLATTTFAIEGSILVPVAIAVGIGVIFTAITYFSRGIMKLDFGKYTIVTLVYSFILFFTTGLAVVLAFYNTMFISLAIGLVLFTVSDLILSMQYFGGKANNNLLQVLNHTSYYLAQITIACTMFIFLLV